MLAYDLDTLASISEDFPFERELSGHHSYVTFVTDAEVLDELAPSPRTPGPDEKIKRGKGVDLLAGAEQGHAGHHDRQDHGQEALQVVDDHPGPADAREGSAAATFGV